MNNDTDHMENPVALSCPFCGKKVDFADGDTLYPTGQGWLEKHGLRFYVKAQEAPKWQWCFGMNCPESSGGCGCRVTGDSEEEALRKWNRRSQHQ